eukprot:315500-Prymnesium_polylepis.3
MRSNGKARSSGSTDASRTSITSRSMWRAAETPRAESSVGHSTSEVRWRTTLVPKQALGLLCCWRHAAYAAAAEALTCWSASRSGPPARWSTCHRCRDTAGSGAPRSSGTSASSTHTSDGVLALGGVATSPICRSWTPRGSAPSPALSKFERNQPNVGGAGSASAACQACRWTSCNVGERPIPSGTDAAGETRRCHCQQHDVPPQPRVRIAAAHNAACSCPRRPAANGRHEKRIAHRNAFPSHF